jgi:selenocysteine-specific elongation factor
MRVVATAGHVDHGKSTLVLALTGTDPDRFAEEKTRGLTIDLGFAFTTLPSGVEIGFVDVPGHVKFLKNMLAGVGAIDVALFVVSAREGWMPQSEEHLVILELLGVRDGVVALTNADSVDEETLEIARAQVDERLARSSWGDALIVACDSVTRRGLDDLGRALDDALAAAPAVVDRDRPRLWVDRVFAARGAGVVVTGTLAGGSVRAGDTLEVARDRTPVRVRGIETAHRRVEDVAPGSRVALNLTGIDRERLARGDALVRPGQWALSTVLDAAMTTVHDHRLRPRDRLHAHVGSAEHDVRFRALDDDGRYGRFVFPVPVALAPGDRFVVRDPGSATTVAGAEVLDVAPPTSVRGAAARLALPLGERLLAERDRWVAVADVARVTGLDAAAADELVESLVTSGRAVRVNDTLIAATLATDLLDRACVAAVERGEMELATLAGTLGVTASDLAPLLATDSRIVVEHGRVRDATRAPVAQSPEAQALVAALDENPFAPPQPTDRALARALVRDGVLVDVGGILFSASALQRARDLVREYLETNDSMSVGDARNVLGSTRKFVVPLLEQFDREGVTRRRGDVRIAGPTISRADSGRVQP